MQYDMFGKQRYKVNLHMHTADSDGCIPHEAAIARYRDAGYDAVAVTEHWFAKRNCENDGGLLRIAGCEYNIGGNNAADGVYHILGLGYDEPPTNIRKTDGAQVIIDKLHRAGATVILAHPAWSLNTPEQIMALEGIDATEIYNSVSNAHNSRRPDSSLIVDMLATRGRFYPLIADDDAHFYDGSDDCISWIMAEAESCTKEDILKAVREGRFYATQGPEIHLHREGDEFVVKCSPCKEIRFFSNITICARMFAGDGLTEARYAFLENESYVRAEVVDAEGRSAWSNIIPIE